MSSIEATTSSFGNGSAPVERWNRAGDLLGIRQEIRDLIQYRDLLRSLVHRDLTIRYKRSPLGFMWTMLHPLILMTIFVIIFGALFRFQISNFAIYFLAPYIGWNFFNQTVVDAMGSLSSWNGALLKRVRVPKSIFVVATTISGLVNLSLSLIPLLLLMLWLRMPIGVSWVFLPVSFLILGVFTLGTAMVLSSLAVYFVDVREMYVALSPAIMYLTPIIYPLEIVPERYRWLIKLNPLVYLLQLFRAPIYFAIFPTGLTVLLAAMLAVFMLAAGWMIFRHLAPGFYTHI